MAEELYSRPIDIGAGGRVIYGTDDGLIAEFYEKPVPMEAISKDLGRPTFEGRIFVKLVSPGNNKTVWDYQATGVVYLYDQQTGEPAGYEVQEPDGGKSDMLKYPKAWERFVKKSSKLTAGWDVSEWGAITRSYAETLKALNIPTVEALAAMTDANAQSFLGGLKFRDLAKAALDEAKLLSLASAEQERANKAEEQNRTLTEAIKALEAQVKSLMAKKSA